MQRSPPTRPIAAGPHHNPATTTAAIPPTIIEKIHGVTMAVGTLAATASIIGGVVRM